MRKVVPLTTDLLRALPDGPRCCVLFELDPVRRERLDPDERAEAKRAWFREVSSTWGSCGYAVVVEDEPVGVVMYAPAAFAPGSSTFPTAPVSADATLLTMLWVHPDQRGRGIAKQLVQRVVRDLLEREAGAALEAFASAHATDACLPPQDFCEAVGFVVHRTHPAFPRMRWDVSRAVTWPETVRDAAGRALSWLRQPKPAQPMARPVERARDVTPGTPPAR